MRRGNIGNDDWTRLQMTLPEVPAVFTRQEKSVNPFGLLLLPFDKSVSPAACVFAHAMVGER